MSRLDFIKLLVGIAMLMVVISAVGKVRPTHDGRMLMAGPGELSADDAFYSARNELLNQDPAKKKVWSSFILIE